MPKIFVDGQEGTTGLEINERLSKRNDLEILKISPEQRKDPQARKTFINEADIVFLCLPDTASRESVALTSNPKTRIIDASTAYRADPQWTYGFPELNAELRKEIQTSRRVSNPGCYAAGFVAAVYPLVRNGIVPRDYPLTCAAVSGYSGAGKKSIAAYENPASEEERIKFSNPRFYALGLHHKHLPEMQKVCGLDYPPLFTPIISNYYKGMTTSVPLTRRLLSQKMDAREIHRVLSDHYSKERFVKVMPYEEEYSRDNGYFSAIDCNGTNTMEIYVFGHDEQILILSRLDNLGKGASGAAVQNMNIMLGLDEGLGLV